MAGEIEEPFRFNFQADLLHSGSISFGRFESESLSWERRSSFSHNQYLEEVEKYSKPGSVTEKKAYFEAHFKRKALLKQSSSDSDSKYGEETEIQKCVKENVETLCSDDANASSHVTKFDGEIFSVVPNDDSIMNHVDHKHDETRQIGTEKGVLVKSEENIGKTFNDIVLIVDVVSEANDLSLTSQGADKGKTISSKVRSASEMKQPKPKLKTHVDSTQPKTRENNGLLMKEKEKKSPRPASPVARSERKFSKPEESSMSFLKAKIYPSNKSIVKEYKSEKTVETNYSVSEKALPAARRTLNRTKQNVITPSKPHFIQSSAGFTFKSDQRAEKRKEEKKAAELTQPRKSLNFKATPMPSFYKDSTRSDQNKVISTSKTPNRPRTASTANSTTSSNPRPSSSTSLTNKNRPSEPSRRVQEKKKNSSSCPKLGYLPVSVST